MEAYGAENYVNARVISDLPTKYLFKDRTTLEEVGKI